MSEVMAKKIYYALVVLIALLAINLLNLSLGSGKYSFSSDPDGWVVVGETRTGNSWRCSTKILYEQYRSGETEINGLPEFNGCLVMMNPNRLGEK